MVEKQSAKATAKNANDINIKIDLNGELKRRKKSKKVAQKRPIAPPVQQTVIQLPPTTVAVPNNVAGRPMYNFVSPRPYDSPDAGGMRIATFPEQFTNYQSRQEVMGVPPAEIPEMPPQMAEMGTQAGQMPAPVMEAQTMTEQPEMSEMGVGTEAPQTAVGSVQVMPQTEEAGIQGESGYGITEEQMRSISDMLEQLRGVPMPSEEVGIQAVPEMFSTGTSVNMPRGRVGIGAMPPPAFPPPPRPVPMPMPPMAQEIAEGSVPLEEVENRLSESLWALPRDESGNPERGMKGRQKDLLTQLNTVRRRMGKPKIDASGAIEEWLEKQK